MHFASLLRRPQPGSAAFCARSTTRRKPDLAAGDASVLGTAPERSQKLSLIRSGCRMPAHRRNLSPTRAGHRAQIGSNGILMDKSERCAG